MMRNMLTLIATVVVVVGSVGCSSSGHTATPSTTVRPASSSQSTTSQPRPSITEASIPEDPAAAKSQACSIWSTVLKGEFAGNINVNDLAPLIRITMGIEPDSTTGQQDPSQPWATLSTDATVVGDPLDSDVTALDDAVTHASPSDLSTLTAPTAKVTQDCG